MPNEDYPKGTVVIETSVGIKMYPGEQAVKLEFDFSDIVHKKNELESTGYIVSKLVANIVDEITLYGIPVHFKDDKKGSISTCVGCSQSVEAMQDCFCSICRDGPYCNDCLRQHEIACEEARNVFEDEFPLW